MKFPPRNPFYHDFSIAIFDVILASGFNCSIKFNVIICECVTAKCKSIPSPFVFNENIRSLFKLNYNIYSSFFYFFFFYSAVGEKQNFQIQIPELALIKVSSNAQFVCRDKIESILYKVKKVWLR